MSRHSRHQQEEDANEDDEWLFESVVAYLNSPIWAIPIQHFIEKHCPSSLFFLDYFYMKIFYINIEYGYKYLALEIVGPGELYLMKTFTKMMMM
jgi:hypothetical protein